MGLFKGIMQHWAKTRGCLVEIIGDIELYCYKDVDAWDRNDSTKAAFTTGDMIMFRSCEEYEDKDIVKHELEHCRQIKSSGGFGMYIPRYIWESLKAWVLTGDTDNNPYEQKALQAEKR
jgi:hypothetical protein